MPLVSGFKVFSCYFGHGKYRHRGLYIATSPLSLNWNNHDETGCSASSDSDTTI